MTHIRVYYFFSTFPSSCHYNFKRFITTSWHNKERHGDSLDQLLSKSWPQGSILDPCVCSQPSQGQAGTGTNPRLDGSARRKIQLFGRKADYLWVTFWLCSWCQTSGRFQKVSVKPSSFSVVWFSYNKPWYHCFNFLDKRAYIMVWVLASNCLGLKLCQEFAFGQVTYSPSCKPVFFMYIEDDSSSNYLQVLIWGLNEITHGKPLATAC